MSPTQASSPPITLATWNINSVRLRLNLVQRFVDTFRPDILCLQETKVEDGQFPAEALAQMGYEYICFHGEKMYNGVAICSRVPIVQQMCHDWAAFRHIGVRLQPAGSASGIWLDNFYVPAGGDIPDPAVNPKFAHKLEFLARMTETFATQDKRNRILVGDLNIAPLPEDVWNHKQLLGVVSHTPVETEALQGVQAAGAWEDAVRRCRPVPETLYSWWSYRARDWRASNRGRRLDHIWASADLCAHIQRVEIVTAARGWDKPSDHTPIIAEMRCP